MWLSIFWDSWTSKNRQANTKQRRNITWRKPQGEDEGRKEKKLKDEENRQRCGNL